MLVHNNLENVDWMCDFTAFVRNVIFRKVKAFVILLQGRIFASSHTFYLIILLLKAKQHTIWKLNFPKVFSLLICFSFCSLCYSGILPYFEMCNLSPWRQQMVWLVCLLVKGLSWEMASRTGCEGGSCPQRALTLILVHHHNICKKNPAKMERFWHFLKLPFS